MIVKRGSMLPSGFVFDGNMNAKLALGDDISPGAGATFKNH
jgi:hypothetical protein